MKIKKTLASTPVLALIACLLWSSAFVGIKLGLPYTTPLRFAGVRFFLAGIIILPFVGKLTNYFRQVRRSWKTVLVVGFFQTFVQYTLFYSGLSRVEGALSAIIVGSSPLFAALIAHLAMPNDKMSWRKTIAIIVGLMGVVFVSVGRKEFSFKGGPELIGILLLIVTNINAGASSVIVARHKSHITPLVLTSSSMIWAGAILFLFALPIEGAEFRTFPPIYYGALAWLSFLSAAAISIWNILLKRPDVKVSNLNFWKFIIPVSGAFLAWSILPNEDPEWVSIAGMGIIGIALLLLNSANRAKKK